MGSYHARLSPSSAHRWTSCTASVTAQEGVPNEGSEASRRGTACHLLLEEMLLDHTIDPQSYLGRKLYFPERGEPSWFLVDQEVVDIALEVKNG